MTEAMLEHEPDVAAHVTAPLRNVTPLGRRELMTAKRKGQDLDELVSQFWTRYEDAWREMEKRVDEAAKSLSVSPFKIWNQVMESNELYEILERRTPPSRWGAMISRALTIAPRPAVSTSTRPGRVIVKRRSRSRSTSSPTRGSPDDGDPEQDAGPWTLTSIDRGRFFWRVRALRCRLLEIREGVDR